MKAYFPLILTMSCLMVAGCHHRTNLTPATQPTTTAPATPVKPAAPKPAVPTTPTTPATPGLNAAATRAQAQQVKAVAPGARVSRVSVPGMYVALTFDDGPSAALTPKALDILKRHNAHGTFFVVGQNVGRNGAILARSVAEGNEIGVHTWSHIKMTGSSREKVDSEVSRTVEAITAATGKAPVLLRPPYGATNAALVNHIYNDYGMRSVLWDVDTLDWRHPGVQKVIDTAVGQAKPGSIILVHDIHASTLAALEGIVTGLQARGFKLVTVSELISLANRAAGKSADAAPTQQPTPAPAPVSSTEAVAQPTAAPTPTAVSEPAAAPAAPETPAEQPAAPEVKPETQPTGPAVDEWLYPTRTAPAQPEQPANN